MIEHLIHPLVCERFLTDARYREGHLRVVNALPARRVAGLHSPETKLLAKQLSAAGANVVMSDGRQHVCSNGAQLISCFEEESSGSLCANYTSFIQWYVKHISYRKVVSKFSFARSVIKFACININSINTCE